MLFNKLLVKPLIDLKRFKELAIHVTDQRETSPLSNTMRPNIIVKFSLSRRDAVEQISHFTT